MAKGAMRVLGNARGKAVPLHVRFMRECVAPMDLGAPQKKRLAQLVLREKIYSPRALFLHLDAAAKKASREFSRNPSLRVHAKAEALGNFTMSEREAGVCREYAECLDLRREAKRHFKKLGFAFFPGTAKIIFAPRKKQDPFLKGLKS